jgi:hypothetical protein
MERVMAAGVGKRLFLFYEEKVTWWRLQTFQDTELTRHLSKR